MSTSIAELLQAFEKLPPNERKEFIREALKRVHRSKSGVELRERGIDEAHAAVLRARV